MKRIICTSLVVIAALSTGVTAGDPPSPLYRARLLATLSGWKAPTAVRLRDPEGPGWWPASLNPASFCVGSVCPQSYCFGSLCAESICLGSGCIGSTCIGSGCVASLCGVSGCAGTTLCLKKCGYSGGPPNAIDPNNNGTTFVNGTCNEP